MRVNLTDKYKNTLYFLIFNKAYLGPDFRVLDRSVYPFILGKRHKNSYYDLYPNLMCLKNSLEILENIILDRGHIFFVGGEVALNTSLLCLAKTPQFNINVIPWDFSQITKIKDFDLLVLNDVNKISQLEIYSKMRPYVGVNCFTTEDLSYLLNLNLQNTILLNWYLYILIYSCRKGLYSRIKKKKNEI